MAVSALQSRSGRRYQMKPDQQQLVFLNPVAGPVLGGGEMVAAEVLDELAGRLWKITLIGPPDSGLFRLPKLQGRIEFLPLDLPARAWGCLKLPTVASRFKELVRQQPEAVWLGNTYRSLKWLALGKMLGARRAWCHLHESVYRPYYFRRTRWLAGRVDGFICISETVRREVIQGTRREDLAAVVIHNGLRPGLPGLVNPAGEKLILRAEFGLPSAKKLVCLPARSDPLKGHEVFLRMAARVRAQRADVCFLIVGGSWGGAGAGEYELAMQALARQLDLEAIVVFRPHSSRVRELMRCADIVAVPSWSEGFGRVAVEAMMEQTAVVASRVGGLAEIIRDGQDGLLAPPGDDAKLAAAVLRLLADDGLRGRIVQTAWHRAMENFSTAAMMDRMENLLRDSS